MTTEFAWVFSKKREINFNWFYLDDNIHGSLIVQPCKYTKNIFSKNDVIFLSTTDANYDINADSFFDGECVFQKELKFNADPKNIDEYFDFINNSRGSYCVGFFHEASGVKLARFANDQLGMYPLLYYVDDDNIVVTNNPIFAESIFKNSSGVKLKRGFKHVINEIVTSSPLDVGPFEGMSFIPFDSELVISQEGKISIKRRKGNDFYYRPSKSESLLFDNAVTEILENVEAIAKSDVKIKIADITGGFDSRLVLAAILKSGLKDEFYFNVNGKYPNPDVNIANFIIEKYDLKKGSLAKNPFKRKSYLSENILHELSTFTYVSSGMKNNIDRHIDSLFLNSNIVQVGGGFSAYKANKSKSLKNEVPNIESAVNVICSGEFSIPNEQIEEIKKNVKTILESWVLDQGMNVYDALDRYHIEYRTRFHIGLCEHWSRLCQPKVHPLHSPALVRLSFHIGYQARLNDQLLFKLMEYLEPSLCLVPLEKRVWNKASYADSVLRNKIISIKPVTDKSERLYSQEPEEKKLTFIQVDKEKSDFFLSRENSAEQALPRLKVDTDWYKLQMKLGRKWHWYNLAHIKAAFDYLLKQSLISSNELSWMKNISHKELSEYKNIKEVLELHALAQFLIFYQGKEIPLRVSY
ncbi:hypothetical protein ACT3R7_06505 [Halomonas sp. AOP43-A1-21]